MGTREGRGRIVFWLIGAAACVAWLSWVVSPEVEAPVANDAAEPEQTLVVPVAKPAPVIPPERREVAAAAPSSAIGAKLDARTVEQIFSCLATGLPSEWRKTWVVVTDSGAAVTGKFYYTVTLRNEDAEEFVPCNAQEVTRRIAGLGEGPGRWRAARLTIDSEGAYRLRIGKPIHPFRKRHVAGLARPFIERRFQPCPVMVAAGVKNVAEGRLL